MGSAHQTVQVANQLVSQEGSVPISADRVIEGRAQNELVEILYVGTRHETRIMHLPVTVDSPKVGLVGLLGAEAAAAPGASVETQSETCRDPEVAIFIEVFPIPLPLRPPAASACGVVHGAVIIGRHGDRQHRKIDGAAVKGSPGNEIAR